MTQQGIKTILFGISVAACIAAVGCASRESALREVRHDRVLRYNRWLAERAEEKRGKVSAPLSMAESVKPCPPPTSTAHTPASTASRI